MKIHQKIYKILYQKKDLYYKEKDTKLLRNLSLYGYNISTEWNIGQYSYSTI